MVNCDCEAGGEDDDDRVLVAVRVDVVDAGDTVDSAEVVYDFVCVEVADDANGVDDGHMFDDAIAAWLLPRLALVQACVLIRTLRMAKYLQISLIRGTSLVDQPCLQLGCNILLMASRVSIKMLFLMISRQQFLMFDNCVVLAMYPFCEKRSITNA